MRQNRIQKLTKSLRCDSIKYWQTSKRKTEKSRRGRQECNEMPSKNQTENKRRCAQGAAARGQVGARLCPPLPRGGGNPYPSGHTVHRNEPRHERCLEVSDRRGDALSIRSDRQGGGCNGRHAAAGHCAAQRFGARGRAHQHPCAERNPGRGLSARADHGVGATRAVPSGRSAESSQQRCGCGRGRRDELCAGADFRHGAVSRRTGDHAVVRPYDGADCARCSAGIGCPFAPAGRQDARAQQADEGYFERHDVVL